MLIINCSQNTQKETIFVSKLTSTKQNFLPSFCRVNNVLIMQTLFFSLNDGSCTQKPRYNEPG